MRTFVVAAHGQVVGMLGKEEHEPVSFVEILDVDQGTTARLEVSEESYRALLVLVYGSEDPTRENPEAEGPSAPQPRGEEPDDF